MKRITLLTMSVFLLQVLVVESVLAIKKCKDSNGNWHYGDIAVAECENSKITTLDDRGFITDQQEAPKSEAELEAEQELALAAEANMLAEKSKEEERRRILSIYETEADIDRQRDNQLNSVQSNIEVHLAYLKSMDTRIQRYKQKQSEITSAKLKQDYQQRIEAAEARIKTSKTELTALEKHKSEIVEKFIKEKEVYLSIKRGQ